MVVYELIRYAKDKESNKLIERYRILFRDEEGARKYHNAIGLENKCIITKRKVMIDRQLIDLLHMLIQQHY